MPNAKRGEVWLADLGLAAKVRPALVINVPFRDNERALFAIIPHTTAARGTRFEVSVSVAGLQSGVFDVQGLRSIPAHVLVHKLSALTAQQLEQVEAGVNQWLGLAD